MLVFKATGLAGCWHSAALPQTCCSSVLLEVGQAILREDWLFSQSFRLKRGGGHDWPPQKKTA